MDSRMLSHGQRGEREDSGSLVVCVPREESEQTVKYRYLRVSS